MVTTYNLADVFFNPFWTGAAATWDFWQIAMGSREQKVKTVTQWLPVGGAVYGLTQNKPIYQKTVQTPLMTRIAEQKKSAEGKVFWGENVLFTTNITTPGMPELPNLDEFFDLLKKWAPLIIGGVVGIYLLGKYLGGKK